MKLITHYQIVGYDPTRDEGGALCGFTLNSLLADDYANGFLSACPDYIIMVHTYLLDVEAETMTYPDISPLAISPKEAHQND